MAHTSKIEWTMATWNPWYGCHKISQGCKNCYMFRDMPKYGKDANVVTRSKTCFYDPLKWSEPRTIFTCSWSDFFIEEADAWRDEAFAIMALTPQHTYQVLTKRPERMLDYLTNHWPSGIAEHLRRLGKVPADQGVSLSTKNGVLHNVWLGVSIEDQKTADERIPLLLQTPAETRWLSIEPLLGPVNLWRIPWGGLPTDVLQGWEVPQTGIRWVVVGGESGPDARPMHPDWPRSIRDQCVAAGVPFFFKQWGEWYGGPNCGEAVETGPYRICRGGTVENVDYERHPDYFFLVGAESVVRRLGKKKAGRILDGRTWDEMPEVSR